MSFGENESKFATTFEEIESIVRKITDLNHEFEEGETMDAYKIRIENSHSSLISRLEGVKLEWIVPDYSDLSEELKPENIGEEVLHINTKDSPIHEMIDSVLRSMSVKS